MNKLLLLLTLSLTGLFATGCESNEVKAKRLASLTCNDNREGRSKDELQAIQEACFRKGVFVKSSGKAW